MGGAVRAVEQVQPAAVLAATSDTDEWDWRSWQRGSPRQPYLPLIAVDPRVQRPDNVIACFRPHLQTLRQRPSTASLRAALRVRSFHATAMRRLHAGNVDGLFAYGSGARRHRAVHRPRRCLSDVVVGAW